MRRRMTPASFRLAGLNSVDSVITTHWSVVRRAGTATTVESMAALDRLCHQYWHPLYYFVRRRGYNEHDAQDLTQGFSRDSWRKV